MLIDKINPYLYNHLSTQEINYIIALSTMIVLIITLLLTYIFYQVKKQSSKLDNKIVKVIDIDIEITDETPAKKVRIRNFKKDSKFSTIMEKLILLRLDQFGYNNNPNANKRILSTLGTSLIIGGLITSIVFVIKRPCLEVERTYEAILVTSMFFTLWLGMFWKEKKDIHNKWQYLADIYNRKLMVNTDYPTKQFNEKINVALAIDALVMGMWAHDSYSEIFKSCLTSAIQLEKPSYTLSEIELFITTEGITYKSAMEYLYRHQCILLDKIQNPLTISPYKYV